MVNPKETNAAPSDQKTDRSKWTQKGSMLDSIDSIDSAPSYQVKFPYTHRRGECRFEGSDHTAY